MPYCRFENTLYALRECLGHIEDGETTSESEIDNAESLYEACQEFIDKCNDYGIRREDGGYENFEDVNIF
jgi:hypothetical protein